MDRWIMLQLLGYIVQICHKQRAENKQQRQEKRDKNKLANRPENEGIKTEYLYPIIPVVFYHGKTRWKVNDFSELFQGNIDTKYFPDFTYELINLADYQDEYFKGNVIARVALMAMKHYFLDDYNEKVPQILDLLASLLENYESEIAFIEALMRYLSTRKPCDKEWLKTNLNKLFKEKGEQVMNSIADIWIEEGRIEEARTSIIDVLKLKYANISQSITTMLQNIQDHNELRILRREAVLARNLSEFQTRLNAYQRV
ncbi:MAG: transposase [Candidatus Magnetoglobus multicellularis str. Araruama]|uniref:Transposase n=1 Tax=Candidatus Magnetoglobus multicellularis str. Araruama TaxID=890399 RepID=A0A1V1PFT8_9BACT|nr:MAG: transposase [Candidatus Magnetoglobus multicellularis str. Araruama]